MKSLETWSSIKAEVELKLEEYCDQMIHDADEIGSGYGDLWREIKSLINAGGKRIRPYLVCLTYAAYEGSDREKIIQIACSWELLHTCLLIHDDIIDRDIIRHNKLNISGKYQERYKKLIDKDSEHYSMSAALLAGDLMLLSSYDIVDRSSASSNIKSQVRKYLRQAFFSSGGGELMDIESAFYPIKSSYPITIANYKTAVYSFQLPMVCGAMVAGASEEELKKLGSIGREVGVAFQLRDDLLGVFGNSTLTNQGG